MFSRAFRLHSKNIWNTVTFVAVMPKAYNQYSVLQRACQKRQDAAPCLSIRRETMKRLTVVCIAAALTMIAQPGSSQTPPEQPATAPAPAPKPPTFETKKVDGTDNVYVF